MHKTTRSAFILLTAVAVWTGLALQFYLSAGKLITEGWSAGGAIIHILSFYTIQTNILIAIALSAVLCMADSRCGRYFSRLSVLTAIAVYISIVGLVYNLMLKGLWKPEGHFKLADTLLHVVSPIAYILCWLFCVPKEKIKWKETLAWAVFPFLYFIYSLIRGAYIGQYPYPFINVAKLGYGRVAVNAVLFLLVFFMIGFVFIMVSRLLTRNESVSDKIQA